MINIPPPNIRRQKALYAVFILKQTVVKIHYYMSLKEIFQLIGSSPVSLHGIVLSPNLTSMKNDQIHGIPTNGSLILDPCKQLKGFNLPRHDWSKLNRFRSG